MMKRMISLLLAVFLLGFAVCACADDSNSMKEDLRLLGRCTDGSGSVPC